MTAATARPKKSKTTEEAVNAVGEKKYKRVKINNKRAFFSKPKHRD